MMMTTTNNRVRATSAPVKALYHLRQEGSPGAVNFHERLDALSCLSAKTAAASLAPILAAYLEGLPKDLCTGLAGLEDRVTS